MLERSQQIMLALRRGRKLLQQIQSTGESLLVERVKSSAQASPSGQSTVAFLASHGADTATLRAFSKFYSSAVINQARGVPLNQLRGNKVNSCPERISLVSRFFLSLVFTSDMHGMVSCSPTLFSFNLSVGSTPANRPKEVIRACMMTRF